LAPKLLHNAIANRLTILFIVLDNIATLLNMVKLEEFTVIRAPVERCFDLARSVEVHLAGNIHSGEMAVAMAGITSGLIGMGERVTWRAKHFGVWQTLTSEITAMERPAYFHDAMIRGIFQSMHHDHYFRALSQQDTEMRDVFCFAAPLGILGRLAELVVLRRYMRALLHERNAVIREIAESPEWRKYLASTPDGR
jgi:ligand-binding SRPBCC domain-containing protein